MPRNSVGNGAERRLDRGLPGANGNEVDASGDGHDADDGRNGDGVLLIGLGMDGADIHNGIPLGIGNTLVNEGGDAQDDEDHSGDCSRFHKGRNQICGRMTASSCYRKCREKWIGRWRGMQAESR